MSKCSCGLEGRYGQVLSHIQNKHRWHPEEVHEYVRASGIGERGKYAKKVKEERPWTEIK